MTQQFYQCTKCKYDYDTTEPFVSLRPRKDTEGNIKLNNVCRKCLSKSKGWFERNPQFWKQKQRTPEFREYQRQYYHKTNRNEQRRTKLGRVRRNRKWVDGVVVEEEKQLTT